MRPKVRDLRRKTDAELVAEARGGAISAFGEIVDRHRAAVVAVAAGRLGSLDEAEDVAQEAFVRAYLRLHQLRTPESLLPWLRRLADRLALMRLRSRREESVEPGRLEAMKAEKQPQGGPEIGGQEGQMLRDLPAPMREAVALTCLAGYTCADSAALLGVREGTVKSRLSRARARLKEEFHMAQEEMAKAKPSDEFTRKTVERLLKEARGLVESGSIGAAGTRADEVLEIQARAGFASGGDAQDLVFDAEAVRIAAMAYQEKRRQDCEANAAQYGYRLQDLDWELIDVDVLCGTTGKPAGTGEDLWGIPLSRQRITCYDARDVCRRLRCSPQLLLEWMDGGCPVLRCWPHVRFDWARLKEWLERNGIRDWPKERDEEVDQPLHVVFRALRRGAMTVEQAISLVERLELA